jgi:hypothetical protein
MLRKIIANIVKSSLGAVKLKVLRGSDMNNHEVQRSAGLMRQDAILIFHIGAFKGQYASGGSTQSCFYKAGADV